MQLARQFPDGSALPSARLGFALRLSTDADPEGGARNQAKSNRLPAHHEDLPYRVELWDSAKQLVEQVLALTAHGSIGYAAYYAAGREYPERYVTLRYNTQIVSRWNGPSGPEM